MVTYSQLKKMKIDLAPLGFDQKGDLGLYYCTPQKAKILAAAGVDGIHYCTIPKFGDMIFAVSPMNIGDCVHPIARNFEDLLCMLLSCTDMAALEQCYAWDEEQYRAYLLDCPSSKEQQEVLDQVRNVFDLKPMEEVFSYVKQLQAEFDYTKIPYTEDYYDTELNPAAPVEPREWKVYYEGGHWAEHGKGRAGKEISIQKSFTWGEEIWHIPAIYSCTKGLVVDYCIEVNNDHEKKFLDKWIPIFENESRVTDDIMSLAEKENPLEINFSSHLFVNEEELFTVSSTVIQWIPEQLLSSTMRNQIESKRLVEHYGLDDSKVWSFHRTSYAWKTKKKPKLSSINLRLERQLEEMEGIHFHNPKVGDIITICHPITKAEHTITVVEYEQQVLKYRTFSSAEYEYPSHHTVMTYTLVPEIPRRNFQIRDCQNNDEPRRNPIFDIIGGADGPTAMFTSIISSNTSQNAALSALHFEPVEDIEWKVIFREKPMEDIEVNIL